MDTKALLSKYQDSLQVEIGALPQRSLTVELNGDLGGFFAHRIGDRFLWIDYDRPSGQVKQYYDCATRALIWVNGRRCFEQHWDYYELTKGGFTLQSQSDQYVALGEYDASVLLTIQRQARTSADQPGGNIQIAQIVTPRKVELGKSWESTETSFWNDAKDEVRSTHNADALCKVKLFGREYETLRIRSVCRQALKASFSECYVAADTGLTVLFRRFNGSGWPNLDELANEERTVVGGETFLHWYDSVPFRS